jgi:hypothetical protein
MEQQILAGLVQRGIPVPVAQGMVANMIAESGLNPDINEIAPLVPGSRGGYGLNQWTGPRRRQFEAFAADRGVPASDLNTQLDFTLWELQNTERRAWDKLQGVDDPVTAARIYSESFLRPGIPNMDKRLREAARLGGVAFDPSMAPQNNALAMQQPGQPPQMQNALAVQPTLADFGFQNNPLDPQAFMRQRNALALNPVV